MTRKGRDRSGTHITVADLVPKICPAPAAHLEPRTPRSMILLPAGVLIRQARINTKGRNPTHARQEVEEGRRESNQPERTGGRRGGRAAGRGGGRSADAYLLSSSVRQRSWPRAWISSPASRRGSTLLFGSLGGREGRRRIKKVATNARSNVAARNAESTTTPQPRTRLPLPATSVGPASDWQHRQTVKHAWAPILRLFGWHISAYLGLSWLISSHKILFILPAEHYSFYQPNTLLEAITLVVSKKKIKKRQ
jgi:hypothetical protein